MLMIPMALAAPTVIVSPSSADAQRGGSATYTVKATAGEQGSYWVDASWQGGSYSSSGAITLKPGQNYVWSIKLSVSNNFPSGSYPVTFTVSNKWKSSATLRVAAPACSNQCLSGQKQCSGSSVKSCVKDSKGCFVWSSADCGAGTCGSFGSNYCSNGNVVKSRTCYDKGCSNNACYSSSRNEVQVVQSCPNGCSNGQCNKLPVCKNQCSSAGQKQCSGNSVQTCVKDSKGCLMWSSLSCKSDQQCSNGNCVQACSGTWKCQTFNTKGYQDCKGQWSSLQKCDGYCLQGDCKKIPSAPALNSGFTSLNGFQFSTCGTPLLTKCFDASASIKDGIISENMMENSKVVYSKSINMKDVPILSAYNPANPPARVQCNNDASILGAYDYNAFCGFSALMLCECGDSDYACKLANSINVMAFCFGITVADEYFKYQPINK